MDASGKLQGSKVVELFSYLIEKRVILSVHMVGTGFERLTCVTGMQEGPGGHILRIDLPDGFKAAARRTNPLLLKFNFNGPDHLEYLFSTQGGAFERNELLIPIPDYVERLQRRKDFRMQTPAGTRMLIKIDKLHAVLSLINISLGGAFGALIKHNCKNLKGSILSIEQRIYNPGILVPADSDQGEVIIIIQKAEVRRIEHEQTKNLYRYAFEFTEIDPNEKKKLVQAIYHFQRQYLQRR